MGLNSVFRKYGVIVSIVFVVALITPTVLAQGIPPVSLETSNEVDKHSQTEAACSPRSAGKEFGKTQDLKFKTEEYRSELKQYCFARDDPTIEFPIYVYIHKDAVVGDEVVLEIIAHDVDSNYNGPDCGPENDRVFFNGEELDPLTGSNNVWHRSPYRIPKNKVKFLGDSGRYYGKNEVKVIRDPQKHQRTNSECWAVAVDHGRLVMPVIPIIFLPGMAGSYLHNNNAGLLRFKEAWPQTVESVVSIGGDSQLDVLELKENGKDAKDPDVDIHVGSPLDRGLTNFYGDIKKFYRKKGVFASEDLKKFTRLIPRSVRKVTPIDPENARYISYGYDWRLALDDLAKGSFASTVQETLTKTGMEQVAVFAHSTGGVIVRDYQRANADKVKLFMAIAVPFYGAGKAYNVLKGWGGSISPIHSKKTMTRLGGNFPGVYMLLPHPDYVKKYEYVLNDLYNDSDKPPKGKLTLRETYITDPQARLNNTAIVNQALDFFDKQTDFKGNMEVYNAYGLKKKGFWKKKEKTHVQFEMRGEAPKEVKRKDITILYGAGDLTVPIESANPNIKGITGKKKFSHSHVDMAGKSDVFEYTWDKYTKDNVGLKEQGNSPLVFSNFADQGQDYDNNGLFDVLNVSLTANAVTPGDYTLIGRLQDAKNVVVSVESMDTTLASGNNKIAFEFPGYTIRNYGQDSAFDVSIETYDKSNFIDLQENLHKTQKYNHSLFETFPNTTLVDSFTILNITEKPIDKDNDGDIDELEIKLKVNVSVGDDRFEFFGYLNKSNDKPVAFAVNRTALVEGIHDVNLLFSGRDLFATSGSTTFDLSVLIFDSGDDELINLGIYRTQAYDQSKFSERPGTFTGKFSDYGNDTNFNTLFDQLTVVAEIDVKESGEYSVTGSLFTNETNKSSRFLGVVEGEKVLSKGIQHISLQFEGIPINESGVPGPYILRDFQLFFNESESDRADFLGFTNKYQPYEFETPPIIIRNIHEQAIDTNNNSLFDVLEVTIEIEAKNFDRYGSNLRLFDKTSQEITFDADIKVGSIFNLTFMFDGNAIYASKSDGPYIAKSLILDFRNGYYLWPGKYVTEQYNFTQFEHNVTNEINEVQLTASTDLNSTDEILAAEIFADAQIVRTIMDWRVNNNSLAQVNMPFALPVVNDTILDYSTFKNNGIINGTNKTPLWVKKGRIGSALQFDGIDDHILIPEHPSLNSRESITLVAWINWNGEVNATDDLQNIITNGEWRRALRVTEPDHWHGGNEVQVVLHVGNTLHTIYSTTNVTEKEWQHLVMTYDGKAINIYVNGNLDTTKNVTGNITAAQVSTFIGTEEADYFFNGLIDEVKIYDRALSAEQIQQQYLNGTQGEETIVTLSEETTQGETWSVAATPSNHQANGKTVLSNDILINKFAQLGIQGTPRIGHSFNITLDSDPGETYFLFMGASGSSPGTPVGDNRFIPVNHDGLNELTLFFPTAIGLTNTPGVLDNNGRGIIQWNVPNLSFLPAIPFFVSCITIDQTQSLPEAVDAICFNQTIHIQP